MVIENLQQENGLKAELLDEGLLQLQGDGKPLRFVVVQKDEPPTYQLDEIIRLKQQQNELIVIARQLFPGIREKLTEHEIAFLDTRGNMFLKAPGIYLRIDGKTAPQLPAIIGNRAFTATGLKVIFQLLQDKDLVNQSQRRIAQQAGVALGNIPLVLEGLKETGYLIALNKKQYIWENRHELLQRWVENYATQLKPKLHKGRYRIMQPWHEITFQTHQTVWGGAPAADLLTNHLRPEKYIIYTQETTTQLLKNYRLIPDKAGDLEVLELFWTPARETTAPAMLVYADLIITGGKRNNETAQIICDEYIKPNL